jgi:phospholipase C
MRKNISLVFNRLSVATISLIVVGFSILGVFSLNVAHAGNSHVNATTTPIQHVVVIMLENHTFDNYFGYLTYHLYQFLHFVT